MASSSKVASSRDGMLQKLDRMKSAFSTEQNSILAQQEALRKATLLKHRKVSTQLKLDMVHRQLSDLRRSAHDEPDSAHRQFYRHQMEELSSELQDLGVTLERVERNAFYIRRRMLSSSSSNLAVVDTPLSASHPAIFCPQGEDGGVAPGTGMERRFRSSVGGFKSRAMRLMSTPPKLRKKFLFGELRAVASLSSLNVKSTSQSTLDEDPSQKISKTRKGPLRFLGSLMDNQIRRRFWNSTKRTKSAGNVLDENKTRSSDDLSKDFNGFMTVKPDVVVHYISSSSSSTSSSEDSDDEEWKRDVKCDAEAPSKEVPNLDTQVDPNVLAEIEDFEKMAAQYISQHSQRTIS